MNVHNEFDTIVPVEIIIRVMESEENIETDENVNHEEEVVESEENLEAE